MASFFGGISNSGNSSQVQRPSASLTKDFSSLLDKLNRDISDTDKRIISSKTQVSQNAAKTLFRKRLEQLAAGNPAVIHRAAEQIPKDRTPSYCQQLVLDFSCSLLTHEVMPESSDDMGEVDLGLFDLPHYSPDMSKIAEQARQQGEFIGKDFPDAVRNASGKTYVLYDKSQPGQPHQVMVGITERGELCEYPLVSYQGRLGIFREGRIDLPTGQPIEGAVFVPLEGIKGKVIGGMPHDESDDSRSIRDLELLRLNAALPPGAVPDVDPPLYEAVAQGRVMPLLGAVLRDAVVDAGVDDGGYAQFPGQRLRAFNTHVQELSKDSDV
jgi:hypothetical protein